MPFYINDYIYNATPPVQYGSPLAFVMSYPYVAFAGQESSGEYIWFGENNGAVWKVINASWNGSGWQQSNSSIASYAEVFAPNGQWTLYSAPAGSPIPIVWTSYYSVNSGGLLSAYSYVAFDTVAVGASNANTAVVARWPLYSSVTIVGFSVVAASISASSCSVNIVYGEVAETGTVPANNANATPGQSVFATDQLITAASGAVQNFNAPTTGIYPGGGEITLRVVTPGGQSIAGLKVTATVLIP
jgi:hypothetical protein